MVTDTAVAVQGGPWLSERESGSWEEVEPKGLMPRAALARLAVWASARSEAPG